MKPPTFAPPSLGDPLGMDQPQYSVRGFRNRYRSVPLSPSSISGIGG
jgi:hypothetical protein